MAGGRVICCVVEPKYDLDPLRLSTRGHNNKLRHLPLAGISLYISQRTVEYLDAEKQDFLRRFACEVIAKGSLNLESCDPILLVDFSCFNREEVEMKLVEMFSILAWCKTHVLLKLASQCTLVIKPAVICNFTQFVVRGLKLIASQLNSHFNDQLSWCNPKLLPKFPFKLSQRQPTL